jgi:MFS family permease
MLRGHEEGVRDISIAAAPIAVAMRPPGIDCSMAANAPYYAICTDLFKPNAAAATGIMVTFFSISGLLTPVLTGWLTDAFGGFEAAFIAVAIFVVSRAVGMLLFAHPHRVHTGPPA